MHQIATSLVVALLLALAHQPAHATLIATNDAAFNFLGAAQDGNNITVDIDNGIEWLDWSLTASRTYTDVFGETQGGTLDGWRYATEADFLNLAASAGVPAAYIDAFSTPGEPSLAALNALLGDGSVVGESVSLSAASFSAGTHSLGGLWRDHDLFDAPNLPQIFYNTTFLDTSSSPRVGHALVRNLIPEPSTALLLMMGLLGLATRRRDRARG